MGAGMSGDVLLAEAAEELKEGQMVRLLAVPLDKDEYPSAVSLDNVKAGEEVRVTGQVAMLGTLLERD